MYTHGLTHKTSWNIQKARYRNKIVLTTSYMRVHYIWQWVNKPKWMKRKKVRTIERSLEWAVKRWFRALLYYVTTLLILAKFFIVRWCLSVNGGRSAGKWFWQYCSNTYTIHSERGFYGRPFRPVNMSLYICALVCFRGQFSLVRSNIMNIKRMLFASWCECTMTHHWNEKWFVVSVSFSTEKKISCVHSVYVSILTKLAENVEFLIPWPLPLHVVFSSFNIHFQCGNCTQFCETKPPKPF